MGTNKKYKGDIKMSKKLQRKNLYMSMDLNDWVVSEAKRTGNSQSAIMVNAIQFYADFKDTMNFIRVLEKEGNLEEMLKEFNG